jgi:hypothetical protein
VRIDHTFNEPRSIGALMGDLERALSTMRPDDLSLEIDSHTDRERSTTRVRFRAYRHRSGT